MTSFLVEAGSGYEIDRKDNSANFTLTDFPVVSLSSAPAVVSEGRQLSFNFQLSRPAPSGGLVVRLALLRDTAPAPGDIQYFVNGSTNITNFQLIRGSNGLITDALVTIAGGATQAGVLSNVINDGVAEEEERVTYGLAVGSGYSINPNRDSASFTIRDR